MNRFSGSKMLLAQQDLFAKSEEQSNNPFLRAVGHAVCFVALLIFGYVAFSSFKYAYPPSHLDAIKLVRKEIAPVKVLPDNPGGEQFLNQDKFIYNSLEDKTQRRDANRDLVLKETKALDEQNAKKVNLEDKKTNTNQSARSQNTVKASVKGGNVVKQNKLPKSQDVSKNSSKKLDSVFDVLE